MRADLLHVVTCVSNPRRFKSRIRLYQAFEAHMLASGVNLTTVECVFGDEPFVLGSTEGVQHVGVRCHTVVWHKESLLNIGIARLPAGAKYIATIDADVLFRDPDWASETVHALQHYPVVQPWTSCIDLGPNGELIGNPHTSFAALWYARRPIVQGPKCKLGGPYTFAHPGYAWAYTRQALEWLGGLIETAALGAADHHMALALIGRVDESVPGGLPAGYSVPLHLWQKRATTHIGGRLGVVPGVIEHGWHGRKEGREYVSRWEILLRNCFDPITDLKKNTHGVIELAGSKPNLENDIMRYFARRNEDTNTIS